MKHLLKYLKDYKKETIIAPLFKLLEAVFELFVPLVVASMIDVGIKNEDTGYIARMCLWLLILATIGLVCSLTAQFFAAKAAVGFSAKLRSALFSHIQGLSFSQIDKAGTSTMITRLTSDINQVQTGVNLVLRLFLRSPIIVFGAMIMAFTIDVKSAIIFVVAIPLLSIVVFGIMFASIPLYKKVQGALDKVLGITRENLTGVRVIRAFHKEEEEIEHFDAQNNTLSSLQIFVGKITAFMNPVTYIIVNGALVVLIYTGAIQVQVGNLSQGEVVALTNYMSQILVELVKLANLIISVTKAVACGDRVWALFEIKNEEKEEIQAKAGKETKAYLEFDHVGLTYPNAGAETLNDIHFSIPKGAVVGVIGGTGSGKTSFVHMLPRFYDYTEGEIYYNGTPLSEISVEIMREKVGIVLQKAVLFKGSIRENLLWGNENASDEELWQALEIAQAKKVVEEKEGMLDFEISQGGKNLSGGQRQRLTIARALVKKPEILILDDSASALDYATEAALRKALKEMDGDTTVFIVSQRTSSIAHADVILVLEDGEAAGIGTHEELLNSCDTYREIYESQFKKEAKGGMTDGK